MKVFYQEDKVQEYLAIINAYIYGLISYNEYMIKTQQCIAFHQLSERQLLQAYARANAFFLEPTQIEHWFQNVLKDHNADDYEKWLALYQKFQNRRPHSVIVGAMEKQ